MIAYESTLKSDQNRDAHPRRTRWWPKSRARIAVDNCSAGGTLSVNLAKGVDMGNGVLLKATNLHRGTVTGFIASAVVVSLFAVARPAMAQLLDISSATLTNSVLQLTFPGRADSYYLLHATLSLSTAFAPVSAVLGTNSDQAFQYPVTTATAMFFRLQELPLTSTASLLGDGIPDSWKLQHGLNPLDRSAVNSIPLGDVRTWPEIYQSETNLAALPVAFFPNPSYTVLVSSLNVSIPVSFTKPFTGQLTYQLSGTAIPKSTGVPGDYLKPAGNVFVNNANSANIVITLVPEPDIEIDRTLVIALSAPPTTNETYAITTGTCVSTVHIVQSTQGVFVGSLTITNGPALGAQPVKMALRPGSGNSTVGLFDVTGNALLGNTFSVPVTIGTNGFQLDGGQFSNVVTNTPWGGNIGVNLTFGLTQFNGGAFSTPVTITLTGLTSSGLSYSGSGTLNLSRSQ